METEPLKGKCIAVTRAEEQSAGLLARLRELGADPIACPAIAFAPPEDFAPLDAAIGSLERYDWLIVSSANGARALLDRMAALGRRSDELVGLTIGAIGPATAEALAEHGLQAAFVPTAYVAEAILAEIGDLAGKRVLLPRADIARETLAAGLRTRGATVDEIAAYRTVPGSGAKALAAVLRAGALDAITFTSSSTVRYLLDGLEQAGISRTDARVLLAETAIVCIGPITAATANDEGLSVDAVAREYTAEGVVEALVEWFALPAV
ncbi:MAG TPA: uroporphyrinogen-III synthase [Roseiflexaceae bacterium]|nr:uroporphyrinogen-III synthase [Roseiflexaceae bacterium]